MSEENKPEVQPSAATTQKQENSIFSGIFSSETTKKAWGFWENAQKQAQEAWQKYDSDALKQRLVELGKTATEYIDEADRKIEVMENDAMSFVKQQGSQIVEKVKEATAHVTEDGEKQQNPEVLFNGPERKPLSRLDSELMKLNSSPLVILEHTKVGDSIPESQRKEFLTAHTELKETYDSLVPAKLTSDEFWGRYSDLRTDLIKRDERRKLLIGKPGQQTEEDELDDWGSSDDEEK